MPSKYSYTIGSNGTAYFYKTEGGKKVRVAQSVVPKKLRDEGVNASVKKSKKSPSKAAYDRLKKARKQIASPSK